MFYELYTWLRDLNNDFALIAYLFGAINAVKDKYGCNGFSIELDQHPLVSYLYIYVIQQSNLLLPDKIKNKIKKIKMLQITQNIINTEK